MYNFRYDTRLSYRKDPQPYVYNDSIGFSKNKLYAGYLTVPFMVNVNTTPNNRKGFSFSAGVSAGYLFEQPQQTGKCRAEVNKNQRRL